MKKEYYAPTLVVEGMLTTAILAGSEKVQIGKNTDEHSHDADAKAFGCDFIDDEE